MALSIANTSSGFGQQSAGVATCSVTRSAGEGLLFAYFYEDLGATPSSISSVVWDPTGDNQSMTLVQEQATTGILGRLALYELKSPTSAKTANVVVTHSGSTVNHYGYICRRIIDFNSTTWITNSAKREEADPTANDLPITVTSATGELVVAFSAVRNDAVYLSAGDVSDYVEGATFYSSRTLQSGSKAGAASVTATFAYDDGTDYANGLIAVSIAPVGASAVAGISRHYARMMTG